MFYFEATSFSSGLRNRSAISSNFYVFFLPEGPILLVFILLLPLLLPLLLLYQPGGSK
jgi:hypothetical protein